MSTNPPPRFQRMTARGFEQEHAAPLPATLAALVADRSEQHGKVAARLAELRGRRIELARQLAEQEAADERAAADAAAAGRSPGRRQKAASLRKKLEETEDELRGFEEGIAKSANGLLEAALPFREPAVEKAAEAQQAAIARAQELLTAADRALAEAGTLTAERAWLARLDGRQRIEPFRPGTGADASLGQLRAILRAAFADWHAQHDRRQAEFEQRQASRPSRRRSGAGTKNKRAGKTQSGASSPQTGQSSSREDVPCARLASASGRPRRTPRRERSLGVRAAPEARWATDPFAPARAGAGAAGDRRGVPRVPVIVVPGYSRPMIRAEAYLALLDASTYCDRCGSEVRP